MSGMLWEALCTLGVVLVAFFVPFGPHMPASKAARAVFVLVPILLFLVSQYLWATTGRSLVERGTCVLMSSAKSCRPSGSNDSAIFNQICPAALAAAQDIDRVPYVAKLATLNAKPLSQRHYTCQAEGRGITYYITVKVRCADLGQSSCLPITRVEKYTGEVIWQALE